MSRIINCLLLSIVLLFLNGCAGGTIGTGTRPPRTNMFGSPNVIIPSETEETENLQESEEEEQDSCKFDRHESKCAKRP